MDLSLKHQSATLERYPEPIGAMLGMTGSESIYATATSDASSHEEFSQQGPADKHGTIFNNQIPTKNEFQWGGPEQEHLDGTLPIPSTSCSYKKIKTLRLFPSRTYRTVRSTPRTLGTKMMSWLQLTTLTAQA